MAITFSCGHCGKSLTTTDDKAGRKAKCPGCGEVLTVPEPESHADEPLDQDFSDDEASEDSSPDLPVPVRKSGGQKACPMCGEKNAREAKTCEYCGEKLEVDDDDSDRERGHGTFDTGDVISAAWVIYKRELGIVLGSVIIAGLVSQAAAIPSQVVNQINQVQMQQGQFDPSMLMIQLGLLVPQYLVTWFMQAGVAVVLLKVARGKDASIGEIFSGGRYFLRMTGASIVLILMTIVGFALLCVPGIIVCLIFWPYTFTLVDEDPPGINCLWRSKEITQGNWGSSFVLGLAFVGLMLLGLMACCVGVIFTAPLAQLALAVAYCRMTNQRTCE